MFLYIGWMLVVPYYLVKNRGAKGLLAIILLMVVWICAWIAGIASAYAVWHFVS